MIERYRPSAPKTYLAVSKSAAVISITVNDDALAIKCYVIEGWHGSFSIIA
jgi:hypothetical protein